MTKTMHGKVHGKTIELDEDLGVVDGQEVEVQVKMIRPRKRLPGPPPGWRPGGTETAAGMMADSWTEEDDRILEEIDRDRKRETRREIPERVFETSRPTPPDSGPPRAEFCPERGRNRSARGNAPGLGCPPRAPP